MSCSTSSEEIDVSSPLEESEIQSATPSEEDMIPVTPSEANGDVLILMHFIPVRVRIIPIVVKNTRKDEINPQGGYLGRAFQMNLIPESKEGVMCGCQELV